MAIVETLRGLSSKIRLFNRTENTQDIGDNRFTPKQAQEIVWYVYYPSGREVYFTDMRDAVMGNAGIPTDELRKSTIEEIREQRGATTGKSTEKLAALGEQFLIDHLGPEEAERTSVLLARRAEETAGVDKKR